VKPIACWRREQASTPWHGISKSPSRPITAGASNTPCSRLTEDFRLDYNTYRPHSTLGYLAPTKLAEQRLDSQGGLSEVVDS